MDVYSFIISFKYIAIFVGTFLEGPTVGILVGFFGRVDYINLPLGFLVHVLGDVIADIFYYSLGYFGGAKIVPRLARILKFSVKDVEGLEEAFKKHSLKLQILGKSTHLVGFTILIVAGITRYRFYKFIIYDVIITLIKSLLLVLVGYYFGGLWEEVNNILLISAGVIIVIVGTQLVLILVRRFIKIKNGEIQIDHKKEEELFKKWKRKRR